MDSPGTYPDSPTDGDDVIYPCKGCGEILEEGKAFELAGNRWHIHCFKCNTCGDPLDSDANLLLLGDGSLICNKCTYSCNACGNKIEDLAILTGDQAFCANCFRCRNCKRKIENLRYARTSQGIFCMSCHESLMARRRKKSRQRQQAAAGTGTNPNTTPILDKSLPALPPTAFTPDPGTPSTEPYSETPTELSPRPRAPRPRKDHSPGNLQRAASSASNDGSDRGNLTLPASTYREPDSAGAGAEEEAFIPLAFDPNPAPAPAPGPSPMTKSKKFSESSNGSNDSRPPRDYFGATARTSRDARNAPSRSSSSDREKPAGNASKPQSSPHIAYQEKGRRPSDNLVETLRKRKEPTPTTANASPGTSAASSSAADRARTQQNASPGVSRADSTNSNSNFKLQDVPLARKAGSRRESKAEVSTAGGQQQQQQQHGPPLGAAAVVGSQATAGPPSASSVDLGSRMGGNNSSSASGFGSGAGLDLTRSPQSHGSEYSQDNDDLSELQASASSLSQKLERPKREDSLAASSLKPSVSHKLTESKSSPTTPTTTTTTHERKGSASSALHGARDAATLAQLNGGWSISSPIPPVESPTSVTLNDPALPPRAPGRASLANALSSPIESYTAPRTAPLPPPSSHQHHNHSHHHKGNESVGSLHSDSAHIASPSVALPRYSGEPGFSLDADMARILGGADEQAEREPSVLRKMSNAVSRHGHGRSFSDRGGSRGSNSYKLVKSPISNGSIDISSPISASPDSKDEVIELRNQLRRAQQRITELEAERLSWQEQNASADIKQANTELREKRSTISILDTQREMLIRELEIMTEEVAKAKDTQRPIDPAVLKLAIYEKFASSLEKLKDGIGDQIEELMQKRQDLTNEITTLIQMKDKGFQEYESLSSKNQQLLEMNNQLVNNIQDFYKTNRHPQAKTSFEGMRGGPNGLGIYHHKEKSDMSMDVRSQDSTPLASSFSQDGDNDGAIIHDASARELKKVKQPKFQTWKKGGQSAAKGIAKGLNRAFASEKQSNSRDEVFISHPYGSVQGGAEPLTVISAPQPINIPKSATEPQRPGFGSFFGQRDKGGKTSQLKHSQSNISNPNLVAAEPPSTLFGSDLTARCDYEKRTIPSIVIKCIQEVQIRGMDLEGIYRKSGGTGQINQIRQGFESNEDYDISDPDLDITAVTSVLKQYLRRLPTPLITFDVYDRFLAAGAIQDKEKRCLELRACLNELPRAHLECAQFLAFHLAQVVNHPSAKMTPLNLAVVFAPTMMRPTSIEREMTDMANQKNAVQALIEDVDRVFGDDP